MTATAAGAVLFALWFVPSANATVGDEGLPGRAQAQNGLPGASARQPGVPAKPDPADPSSDSDDPSLADTGGVDTTPYLVGGTAFLSCGAVLVAVATRRSRGTAF